MIIDLLYFIKGKIYNNEDEIRRKYNLPKEEIRYTLRSNDWEIYKKLNSFRTTRERAREFFNSHKIPIKPRK